MRTNDSFTQTAAAGATQLAGDGASADAATLPVAVGIGFFGLAVVAAAVYAIRQGRIPVSVPATPGELVPVSRRRNRLELDSKTLTRDSVIMTGALALLLVGVPLRLFARLLAIRSAVDAGTPLASTLVPADGLWLALVALWLLAMHALLRRTRLPRDSKLAPHFAQAAARQAIELSLFGAGPMLGWTTANPRVGIEWLELPTAADGADHIDEHQDAGDDAAARTLIARPAVEAPPALPAPPVRTTDYEVERGDTFWSLAESIYGDGRHWQKIRHLNLGREVAAGVVMNERSDLSTGWTIVLPVVRKKDAEDESA